MIRSLRLALCFAVILGLAPAGRAGDPAPSAPHAAPAEGHPASPQAAPHAADPHGADPHGEGAHHGPEVKLFGIHLGTLGQFGLKVFNFAVFAGLLFFLLKGALSSAFKARAQELKDQLAQAERDKAEAEAQMHELEQRMGQLQQELDGLLARTEEEATAEKARILEVARAEADQILAQAQQDIAHHHRLAEQDLRALVAKLAAEGAEARLKAQVQGDLAARVLDRSISQVGGTL